MSHAPLRIENDCLNCGTIVKGRYCYLCGQENVVPKETFWKMLIHFFYDITHFDGSFFTTVKDLFFKPGFLSKEYMRGRRKSYLHPIRMYVFTSAFFFLMFFSFFSPVVNLNIGSDDLISKVERESQIKTLQNELKKTPGDSIAHKQLDILLDTSIAVKNSDLQAISGDIPSVSINEKKYYSIREYDSLQKLLPVSERDGWFLRQMVLKGIEVNKKIKKDPNKAIREIGDIVLHKLPYMLLISLPLFALVLKLLYIRRKQFYFADHGIFTIHLYIFTFLTLLALFILGGLFSWLKLGGIVFINIIFFLGVYFYLYKAMRKFYEQKRFISMIKFFLVSMASLVIIIALSVIFFFFSIFTL